MSSFGSFSASRISPFLIEEASKQFPDFLHEIKKKIGFFLWIHFGFAILASAELLFFLSSLLIPPLKRESSFLLALFFFTLFFYLILRFFLEEKKESAFSELIEKFTEKSKSSVTGAEDIIEQHLALASLAKRASLWLEDKEYTLYPPPRFFKDQAHLFERFSAFLAWKDCFNLREKLLSYAISENLKAVKLSPTSLEGHILLASAYVMLSKIYAEPKKEDEDKWISQKRFSEKRLARFREIANFAIEEFKILSEFAPEDPWILLQLAQSYNDLGMIEEETREIEKLKRLRPNDSETLLKLGLLYFQQGNNASALKIYDRLKAIDSEKAEEMILLYGSPLT